jgi:hypothetical protein
MLQRQRPGELYFHIWQGQIICLFSKTSVSTLALTLLFIVVGAKRAKLVADRLPASSAGSIKYVCNCMPVSTVWYEHSARAG